MTYLVEDSDADFNDNPTFDILNGTGGDLHNVGRGVSIGW
jgi:hypothetical protein